MSQSPTLNPKPLGFGISLATAPEPATAGFRESAPHDLSPPWLATSMHQDLGFRVQGSGFRASGSGFRV